jgi:hypothetical protein
MKISIKKIEWWPVWVMSDLADPCADKIIDVETKKIAEWREVLEKFYATQKEIISYIEEEK